MAQGAIKSRKPSVPSSRRTANPKKGQRTIAPKKKALVKQNGITKKYTAGLTGKTERTLAERVGHLEMLAGGKKRGGDEKGEGKKEKAKGKIGK